MKKFGFGKKSSGDDGEDSSRSALFGRKKSSPAPQSDNPYARQVPANDPYADTAKYAHMTPYQQARTDLGRPSPSQPPYQPGPPDPRPQPRAYGSSSTGDIRDAPPKPAGFGPDRYGSGAGYGASRYDDRPNPPSSNARGPGGYGGLGRANDNDPDENRDTLFSGAQERYAQKQQQTQPAPPGQTDTGADSGQNYGGYGEQRELTAEEQEEADYQGIVAEKRALQQESASSVNRSVQMARQANEVGRATLARLGAQGERLHNTEKHLDLAANQNKIAQDKASELKTLNRSMFAVHVGNPFTSKQRQQAADEEVLRRHQMEREQREMTRKEGYQANQRMESNFKQMGGAAPRQQARKKDYGKFNLEGEEGADELEDQIDDGLAELEGQVSMMNMVGRAIGTEVDSQNKKIDRIMEKSDLVDNATRMNRERLARIK